MQSILIFCFGLFCFGDVPAGEYHIKVFCTLPWGGVNSVDALKILQHFIGLNYLTGLRLSAAMTNDDAVINSVDALLAMKRYVGSISGFAKGDWIFAPATFLYSNQQINLLIPGLCVGDVNNSYTP